VTITGMLEQIGRSVAGVGGSVDRIDRNARAVLAAAGHVLIRPAASA